MTRRILCVDDESKVLEGIGRHLRRRFDLDATTRYDEALEWIRQGRSYAVVLTDMHMPGMDGVTFLSHVRTASPNTVRMMLTGCAELSVAMEAVNNGNVFRFLTKPCPPERLVAALDDGLRQFELIESERVLLEQTLRGAVKVLCELMSLACPTAFGCATRIAKLVLALAAELKLANVWQIELAALLSQIGCIAVPPAILERAYGGESLSESECRALGRAPELGARLLSHIPRLEPVARIVARQADVAAEAPVESRVLRLTLEVDRLRSRGLSDRDVVAQLRASPEPHDAALLAALESVLNVEERYEPRLLPISELANHMLLAQDVRMNDGTLLLAKGLEVTLGMRERLANFAESGRVSGPVHVLVRVVGRART
ncbi:MAG: hypothetical protein CHACPFDD_02640 [Phycisphaerae bacterium]|nr:hypothetical protein [Phycisphaerae bacterium]